MTDQHRATPEQWAHHEWRADDSDSSCILELRARVEELGQQIKELQTIHNTATDWRMEQDGRLTALESQHETQRLATLEWGKDVDNHGRWIDDHLKRIMALEAMATTRSFKIDTSKWSDEQRQQFLGELSEPTTLERFTDPRLGEPWPAPAPPARHDLTNVAPLLWVLWNHQGSQSSAGQPIRRYLGMGQFERMSKEQVEAAASFGSIPFPVQPAPSPAVDRVRDLQDRIRDGSLTLAEALAEIGAPTPAPAPADSLVERVADAIGTADDEGLTNMTWSYHARAAIREVAAALIDWHDSDQLIRTAWEAGKWLEQQANR
jgi:hypothetical protein